MDIRISPLPAGTPAPRFSLPRSAYASVSLSDLRGQRGVLIFYPADWEPVSQQQLSLCQEHLTEFTALRAQLIGISSDHIWSHAAFAAATGIRFPLLSDIHRRGAVARMFGVFDAQSDLSARALFVLDEAGVIRWSRSFPAAINPGVGGILSALESLPTHRPSGTRRASQPNFSTTDEPAKARKRP